MKKRAPDGLLLIDKPTGLTSFGVVAAVRRAFGVREVGHAGTLDPLATGLLPVLVGECTKLSPYLTGLGKRYQARVRLGVGTDTYDAEGRVTAEAPPGAVEALDEAAVRAAIAGFVGVIAQRPPAYSAIKREGQRLYQRARAGEVVEVEPRRVEVRSITIDRRAGSEIDLTIDCSKGTYIRSIAHDLGEALGVHGHLTALRRTRIGPLTVEDALPPDAPPAALEAALIPPERALGHLPAITVDAEGVRRLRMGQQAALDPFDGSMGPVRVLDEAGRLVAVAGPGEGGRLALQRVLRPEPA